MRKETNLQIIVDESVKPFLPWKDMDRESWT
jgi:hypothetical protein